MVEAAKAEEEWNLFLDRDSLQSRLFLYRPRIGAPPPTQPASQCNLQTEPSEPNRSIPSAA